MNEVEYQVLIVGVLNRSLRLSINGLLAGSPPSRGAAGAVLASPCVE